MARKCQKEWAFSVGYLLGDALERQRLIDGKQG